MGQPALALAQEAHRLLIPGCAAHHRERRAHGVRLFKPPVLTLFDSAYSDTVRVAFRRYQAGYRAPGRPWQPGHCLALRARRRRRGRCAPGRALPVCSPRNCARCLLVGGVGMSKKSCAARCSRGSVQGVLRAPAEGEGGVAHRVHTARTLLPPPPPRSSGASVRWLMARGRRASGVAAAPRSHATGAPAATRRRRAVGGACACRERSNGRRRPCGGGGGGGAHTNSELPQAGFP